MITDLHAKFQKLPLDSILQGTTHPLQRLPPWRFKPL